MIMIKATVKNGRLEVVVPADWPDGTEVEVHPCEQEAQGDTDGMSAEEIVQVLSAMDRMEPLEITDAERAAWEAEREARNRREKLQFAERAHGLRSVWE